MNRQPPAVVELENDDLEQVGPTIRPEEQRPAWFVVSFLECVAGKRLLDRMKDVSLGNAVIAR